jgi:hypothetical protein
MDKTLNSILSTIERKRAGKKEREERRKEKGIFNIVLFFVILKLASFFHLFQSCIRSLSQGYLNAKGGDNIARRIKYLLCTTTLPANVLLPLFVCLFVLNFCLKAF